MFQLQPQSKPQFPQPLQIDYTEILLAIICMFAALAIVWVIHKLLHVEGSNLIGRLEVVAFGILAAPFVIAIVVQLSHQVRNPAEKYYILAPSEIFTIFGALAGSLAIYLGARYMEKRLSLGRSRRRR